MQHKKCPSFSTFNALFGETPNCKPVDPQEIGGWIDEDSWADGDEDGYHEVDGDADNEHQHDSPFGNPDEAEDQTANQTSNVIGHAPSRQQLVLPAVASRPVVPVPPPAASGKTAAPFYLAPSKKVRSTARTTIT